MKPSVPAQSPDEIFDVVDENDRVVGRATRAEVHRRRLLHRAVHIVVSDGRGNVVLQKRSLAKDTCPGLLSTSCAGHVDAGESYEQAARRELESLNDALAAICDGLESDARIPAEQAQRAAASLKKMTEMLRELRGSARAIQEQISPENLEIRRRMLREMQNQYAPLIDAAKGLFL